MKEEKKPSMTMKEPVLAGSFSYILSIKSLLSGGLLHFAWKVLKGKATSSKHWMEATSTGDFPTKAEIQQEEPEDTNRKAQEFPLMTSKSEFPW